MTCSYFSNYVKFDIDFWLSDSFDEYSKYLAGNLNRLWINLCNNYIIELRWEIVLMSEWSRGVVWVQLTCWLEVSQQLTTGTKVVKFKFSKIDRQQSWTLISNWANLKYETKKIWTRRCFKKNTIATWRGFTDYSLLFRGTNQCCETFRAVLYANLPKPFLIFF